jgi:hypothetical protein
MSELPPKPPSARKLFKGILREHVLRAIEDFNQGLEHDLEASASRDDHELIHENKAYSPTIILGIACRDIEGGRQLTSDDFGGIEHRARYQALTGADFEVRLKEVAFTWVPIHLELAEKLGDYKDRSGELVDMLRRMKEKDLPTIPLKDGVEEPDIKDLEEIDPFTFYSNFNRGVTDENRMKMWRMVKEELNLSSEVPSNFDGLPTYNMQAARLFWHAPSRDEDHIPLLWEFFGHVLTATPETLDLELMDRCLGKTGVGLAYLTIGMYWIRPKTFVSADRKNREKASKLGISSAVETASDYQAWLIALLEKLEGKTMAFSADAHLEAIEKKTLKSMSINEDSSSWFSDLSQKAKYENSCKEIALEKLGEKIGEPLTSSPRRREVKDNSGHIRAACMLSVNLRKNYQFWLPRDLEADLRNSKFDSYILLVFGYPTKAYAIPISIFADSFAENPQGKESRILNVSQNSENPLLRIDNGGSISLENFFLCECKPDIEIENFGESIEELGHPFDALFENLEQAHEMLDFWKETILVLQDEETERSKPLVLSSRRQGKKVWIVLNFGQWVVLSFSSTDGLHVTLPRDLLNELKGENFEGGFSEKLDGVKYTHKQLDLDILLGEEVKPVYDDTLVKIRNKFGDWSGSPYNQAHRSELYEGIMDSEKRLQILRDGISYRSQSLGSRRTVWVIAPGEGGKEWKNFQSESISSIGWNETGDLSGLEEKKAFQEAVAESHPESGSQKVGKMLHDFAVRMQEGDLIFAKAGTKAILGWGIVSSDYRYEENGIPHVHIRDVQWKEDARFDLPEKVRLPIKTLTRYDEDHSLCQILGEFYDCFSSPEVDTAPEYSKEEALKELFLGKEKFDKIIQTLRRKKNLVLQGAPGTGKTFIAKRVAFTLMGVKDDSRAQMIQFHQSSSYEDFIQGFRPNADGRFVLRDGVFHQFCQLAKGSPDDDFVFIIDEINRGNLSKVFGELMMLIEPDKRDPKYAMQLSYSEGENELFYVPENLYVIGTMNTADRSLSLVDYALRRRFAFLEMEPNFESPVFEETLSKRGISSVMITRIRTMMSGLNKKIEDDAMNLGKGFRVGHSFFVPTNKVLHEKEWFDGIIEFEILPLIEEYWMDDPSGLGEARTIIGLEA